jgi:hypothetical protein
VQQDVLRLDVAVDHAVAVGVVERARDLGGDPHRIADRELLLAHEPVAQRLALDERHDVVRRPVDLAESMSPRMCGCCRPAIVSNLAEEPVGADHRRELGRSTLIATRRWCLMSSRQIHGGHSAGAELALDAVAVSEGSSKTRFGVAHRRASPASLRRTIQMFAWTSRAA